MITLFYDATSLPSVVTALRLQRLADAGAEVRFTGLDMLGLAISVPLTPEQRGEVHAWAGPARELGIEPRVPSRRPPTLGAHLVGELAQADGSGAAWRTTLFAAYWHHDADLADETVLVELAAEAGLDAGRVAALLADPGARRGLSARMAAERRRGIGGVPLLDVGGVLISAELSDDDLHALASL